MTRYLELALALLILLPVAAVAAEKKPRVTAIECIGNVDGPLTTGPNPITFIVRWKPRKDGRCVAADAPDPYREGYETIVDGKRVYAAPCPPRCW